MRIRFLAAGLVGPVGLVLAVDAGNAQQQPQGQLPPITVTPPPAKKKAAAPQPEQQPSAPATAQPAAVPQAASPDADAIQSIDPAADAVGKAQSAARAWCRAPELEARPIYRTGELLEAVPGLVVTQHSGEGKANQYFLRGFNLDHGTDLAITVDGMPVNMRTHGHGQGYADTNFMIPEIMRGLAYRKGPYFAAEGDFSSAGAIHLDVVDRLEKNFAQVEIGSFGHRRAVTGMSAPVGLDGTVLVAGEVVRFDGPWDRPDDLRKLNGVLRYSHGTYDNGFALTAMAYSGHWYATDQIPQRRRRRGHHRPLRQRSTPPTAASPTAISLSARWNETDAEAATRVNAYVIKQRPAALQQLHLFPRRPRRRRPVQAGRRPLDRRRQGQPARLLRHGPGGLRSETTVGVADPLRRPSTVGLFNTKERADPLDRARGRRARGERRRVRRDHAALDAVAAHHRRPARRPLHGRRRRATWRRTPAAPATRSSAPRSASCSAPGPRPSSISTPAPAFTATMRAAPSPRSIP